MAKKQIVIVGGGISGLSCAWRLQQSLAFKSGAIAITLVEAAGRLGGIIDTEQHADCYLESGPDSFITNKPYMLDLADSLDLSNEIIPTEIKGRGAMVVSKGKLVKLPEGFSLMAPTQILPFLESPIMSWAGKLRVMCEPFLPARNSDEDESLADFVRRRFGAEMLERIAQPMVGGIYVGDAEKLSALMTAERFVALEKSDSSVLGGLQKKQNTADGADGGVRYGLFCSFRRGMVTLIQALQKRLDGVDVRLSTRVLAVQKSEQEGWQLRLDAADGQTTIAADRLVLALPARISAALLGDQAPALAEQLAKIEAASSAVVNFVLKKDWFKSPPEAFGLVVPEVEMRRMGLSVIALAFASNKFGGRAPADKMVVRAFLGGVKGESSLANSDEKLIDLALSDLRRLVDLGPEAPLYSAVHRWPGSMPQYLVGHKLLLSAIDKALAEQENLFLAGASYRGVGLPECVNAGNLCAEKILQAFTPSQMVV